MIARPKDFRLAKAGIGTNLSERPSSAHFYLVRFWPEFAVRVGASEGLVRALIVCILQTVSCLQRGHIICVPPCWLWLLARKSAPHRFRRHRHRPLQ